MLDFGRHFSRSPCKVVSLLMIGVWQWQFLCSPQSWPIYLFDFLRHSVLSTLPSAGFCIEEGFKKKDGLKTNWTLGRRILRTSWKQWIGIHVYKIGKMSCWATKQLQFCDRSLIAKRWFHQSTCALLASKVLARAFVRLDSRQFSLINWHHGHQFRRYYWLKPYTAAPEMKNHLS